MPSLANAIPRRIWEKVGEHPSVLDYGAKCDALMVYDGAITSATTALVSAAGLFSASHVGAVIRVARAGNAGNPLVSTIAAYVSPTQITLADAAEETVADAAVTWGTDDTDAINTGIASVAASPRSVLEIPGLSLVTGAIIAADYLTLLGVGKTAGIVAAVDSAQASGMIECDGITDITIDNLQLFFGTGQDDGQFQAAVRCLNTTRPIVRNCYISGGKTDGSGSVYGVRFGDGSTHGLVENNEIVGDSASGSPTYYVMGVLIDSPLADGSNGWLTGVTPAAPTTVYHKILGNRISGGVYGVQTVNASYVTIDSNRVMNTLYRGLYIGYDSASINISGNHLMDCGSTNILCAYGPTDVNITANTIDGNENSERTCVQIYYGARRVNVVGNKIVNAGDHCIQVAYKADDVLIEGNMLSGYKSGNAIRIAGALPSNYPVLFAGGGVHRVTVRGNHIIGTTGLYVVYLKAKDATTIQGNVEVSDIVIEGNTFSGGDTSVVVEKNPDAEVVSGVNVGLNNYLSYEINDIDSNMPIVVQMRGTAPPGTRYWAAGSMVYNTAPSAGGAFGFVCVSSGNPGTWKEVGMVDYQRQTNIAPQFQVVDVDTPTTSGRFGRDSTGVYITSDTDDKAILLYTKTGGTLTPWLKLTHTGVLQMLKSDGNVRWQQYADGSMEIGQSGAKVLIGTGAPEGSVVGSPGDFYLRYGSEQNAAAMMWTKHFGFGSNTGWRPIAHFAGTPTYERPVKTSNVGFLTADKIALTGTGAANDIDVSGLTDGALIKRNGTALGSLAISGTGFVAVLSGVVQSSAQKVRLDNDTDVSMSGKNAGRVAVIGAGGNSIDEVSDSNLVAQLENEIVTALLANSTFLNGVINATQESIKDYVVANVTVQINDPTHGHEVNPPDTAVATSTGITAELA